MSRIQQVRGRGLEEALSFVHSLYWARHTVWVQHNGISGVWRVDRNTNRRMFMPVSREAAPDYYGCVAGRFVAFDAKTTEHKHRWKLDQEREHQYRALARLAEAGAVCWLAVEQRIADLLHLQRILPTSEWPTVSFDEGHRPPLHLTVGWAGEVGGYDWLPVVREAWL